MLRPSAHTTVPEDGMPPPKKMTHEELVEERLDLIVHYMQRQDRRERWKTVGSWVHGLFVFVPMILTLISLWYVYAHAGELIKQISSETVKQMWQSPQESSAGFFDQLKGWFPQSESSSSRR